MAVNGSQIAQLIGWLWLASDHKPGTKPIFFCGMMRILLGHSCCRLNQISYIATEVE